MKAETFKGEVAQAYGKELPTPVKFEGTFEAFENYEEIKTANEIPSNEEIVTFVNAKRKAAARAKATTAALDAAGYAKPDPKDPAVIRENMIKQTMALYNVPREVAEQIQNAAATAAKAVAAQ